MLETFSNTWRGERDNGWHLFDRDVLRGSYSDTLFKESLVSFVGYPLCADDADQKRPETAENLK